MFYVCSRFDYDDGFLTSPGNPDRSIECNNDLVTNDDEQDVEFPCIEAIEDRMGRNKELEAQQAQGFPVAEQERRESDGTTENNIRRSITPGTSIGNQRKPTIAIRDLS